jgi:epoxyqueuosine reductase QueG
LEATTIADLFFAQFVVYTRKENAMKLEEHPTVKWYRGQSQSTKTTEPRSTIDAEWLRKLCRDAGADDVGFVEIDRPALAEQKEELLNLLPGTRTLVCLVYRMNREDMRTVGHSVTNLEFRHVWETANRTARHIVRRLQDSGYRALHVPAGFPMEADRWPSKMWLTCDKVNAEQSGMGHMGWNRILLHPRFGSMVALGTVLLRNQITAYDKPLAYNPCIECKLCVTACPVGAIAADGHFDFSSCYTHNYRERLGGFADWIGRVVSSRSVKAYRQKVTDAETISMWQNLSMGAQTRCDKCMAVCPSGEDAIGEFLSDRKGYIDRYLKRLRDKEEIIYVVAGSDAEAFAMATYPSKMIRRVSNGIRPHSAAMFLEALPLIFQRNQSERLDATFHFTFTGEEQCQGTAIITDKTIEVQEGLVGSSDLHVNADSRTWTSFLAKETNLAWALITRRIKIKGSPRLMKAFAKCFPS